MTLATMICDVATGQRADVLDDIARPAAALSIWERELAPDLYEALTLLDFDKIDDIAVELVACTAPDGTLHDAGYPNASVAAIAADIAMLARRHATLTSTDRLALRLEVVETDACRRFHTDYVTLRMLCTYIGPGTQWHRVAEPDTVCQVPAGAVAVFKGRRLLDPPTVLHRSPPIVATGERRLLLVIDPA